MVWYIVITVANLTTLIVSQILAICTTVLPLLEAARELVVRGRHCSSRKVPVKDAEGLGQGHSQSVDEYIFRQVAFSRVDGAMPEVRRRAMSF